MAERATPVLGSGPIIHKFTVKVAAGVKLEAGHGACIEQGTGAGYAKPAADATTSLKTVGLVCATADNTGGSAGDIEVEVEAGVFRLENSTSGDAITFADRFKTCYWAGSAKVAKTDNSSARSAAGKIMDVDAIGVWVQLMP